ncbi:hypothetical protein FRC02_010987 [Tulasnella sp. 418]|nr:hypothetical protein FRC02_010987 [Tulasnella sp. 418]
MPPIPTPDEIPIFLGDLSPEDAANWLKTLVAETGHYSDTGMFRLLTTKFEDGSLAREWYDDLRDEAKTSWALFEREFRSRWISAPRQQRQNKAVWDEFCNHKLIYSTIFAHDSLDPSKSRQVVHDWVEQHLRLGEAVSSEYEDKLVETTFNLLPVFLRAFLQSFNTGYTPNLRSLESCGKMVKQMPTNMYKFEWIRSQMAAEERYSEIS